MEPTRLAPLSNEFERVQLGDERLKRRLLQIVNAAEKAPSSSLPVQAGTSAALEGTYRFIENDSVSAQAILDAHVDCTVERAQEHDFVYVIHDTTKFKFGGNKREGLGPIHSGKSRGFFGHYSLCMSPMGEPLGTTGLYAWHRDEAIKGKRSQVDSQSDPNRESLRWIDQSLHVGELLHDKVDAIHLMDREGDSYELFSFLQEFDQRFVIRLSHDRRLEPGRNAPGLPKLFESLSSATYFFEREVVLSARNKRANAGFLPGFPIRESRRARLEVRAERREIFIGHQSAAHLPRSLTLNFVEVREVEPPEGEEPVVWRLVTTEPIDTAEQVAFVVDSYRRRWLIEEFFKALKTGCGYEKHQAQSSHTLKILLAIETAVAWRMLAARWLAHNKPETPGKKILNENQLLLLGLLARENNRELPSEPTALQVFYEIAAIGGHIKNNGLPGWLVLRRGFDQLLQIERGWALAQTMAEASPPENRSESLS